MGVGHSNHLDIGSSFLPAAVKMRWLTVRKRRQTRRPPAAGGKWLRLHWAGGCSDNGAISSYSSPLICGTSSSPGATIPAAACSTGRSQSESTENVQNSSFFGRHTNLRPTTAARRDRLPRAVHTKNCLRIRVFQAGMIVRTGKMKDLLESFWHFPFLRFDNRLQVNRCPAIIVRR